MFTCYLEDYHCCFKIDPNNKELIAKQKKLLNKRLGLDVAEGLGIGGDEELFKEEDLFTKTATNHYIKSTGDGNKAIEKHQCGDTFSFVTI